mmetsp:Transcript_10108/g.7575  ORF Transcript_10108/g.7575 Transcript_10108/m.7575 type:complete len:158 (-) Transcript_10108:146-619(-)
MLMSLGVITYGRYVSLYTRLTVGFSLFTILMILLPLDTQYLSGDNQSTGYALSIVLLLIFGVFSGVLQSSVFGLGGVLPSKYMGMIMFGNGVSGLFTNFVQIIILLTLPDEEFLGAMIYFGISAFFLLLCAFCGVVLMKNRYFQHYYKKSNRAQSIM